MAEKKYCFVLYLNQKHNNGVLQRFVKSSDFNQTIQEKQRSRTKRTGKALELNTPEKQTKTVDQQSKITRDRSVPTDQLPSPGTAAVSKFVFLAGGAFVRVRRDTFAQQRLTSTRRGITMEEAGNVHFARRK